VPHKRVLRAGESIKRELGFILDRKLLDPRIGMVTVTRVDMSEDLRYAKVFVSFMTDGEEREQSLRLLRRARKFVRGELAHSLRLRIAPELTFVIDTSSENYIRIAKMLKQVEEEDSDRLRAGAEAGQPGGEERVDPSAEDGRAAHSPDDDDGGRRGNDDDGDRERDDDDDGRLRCEDEAGQ
jgi:ribosome-binding factor A